MSYSLNSLESRGLYNGSNRGLSLGFFRATRSLEYSSRGANRPP